MPRPTYRAIIDKESAFWARSNLLKRQQIEKAHEVYHGVRFFTLSNGKGVPSSPSCTLSQQSARA